MPLASTTGTAIAITEDKNEGDFAFSYEYDAMHTGNAGHLLFKGKNIGQYWLEFEKQGAVGRERSYWQRAELDERHRITPRLKVPEAELLSLVRRQNTTEYEGRRSGTRKTRFGPKKLENGRMRI